MGAELLRAYCCMVRASVGDQDVGNILPLKSGEVRLRRVCWKIEGFVLLFGLYKIVYILFRTDWAKSFSLFPHS